MARPVIATTDENGNPIRTAKEVGKLPRVGDELYRSGGRYRKVVAVRTVGQNGLEIDYIDKRGNKKSCWITTWEIWCRSAETPGQIAAKKVAMQKWRQSYEGRHEK